jgi:hypothetical protein
MRSSLCLPAACALLLLGGCGNPGPPEPPSLLLPIPVNDLAAVRTGGIVSLRWTMSLRTTDKLLLKGQERAAVCRAIDRGPCLPVGTVQDAPGKPAHFDDTLPPQLTSGAPHLLRYTVRLRNKHDHDAGPSNPAYTASGFAPPVVEQVTAQTTAQGIVIGWTAPPSPETLPPTGARLWANLQRTRLLQKGESAKPTRAETDAGVPQPLVQTLRTEERNIGGQWLPKQTLDSDARLNRTYRYTVQLMETEAVDGHPITLQGTSAESAPLDARDTFPPAVPDGLDAAANPQGATIDLSWNPDPSTDTIGYFVYRRVAGETTPPVRVSGAKPVPQPAWSDPTAKPGVRYAYSVSAIDASSNESGRSAEITAVLSPADH